MWIHLLPLELIDGASPAPVVSAAVTSVHGKRRHTFLRRGPRLPWDDSERSEDKQPDVVVVSKRKRVKLPPAAVEEIRPIPIQTVKEISGVQITVPDVGTARLAKQVQDEEDDLIIWMI